VGLLQAGALIALDKVNLHCLDFLRSHLSPIEHDLRVVVLDLVKVDYLVALETFQEVEVDLEAGWNAKNTYNHAEAAIWSDDGRKNTCYIGSIIGRSNRFRLHKNGCF
jgi:hypothetical protein